jgi:xanthine/uracil permease
MVTMRWMAAATRLDAASVIPHGGPAIAIFVAGLFVAVVGAIVAMEKQHNPFTWSVLGFVVAVVGASAVHALF